MLTQPGIYHIHMDITRASDGLRNFAESLGFVGSNFAGHPEGFRHFEPAAHMTLKVDGAFPFSRAWVQLVERTESDSEFVGYLEGEYIVTDERLISEHLDYRGLSVPFQISRRQLTGMGRREHFRQAELHLVLDPLNSDPLLQQRLLEAGLFGAYLPKEGGPDRGGWTDLVLTAQGTVPQIHPLVNVVRDFILEAGGVDGCTLKEERAIRYHLQGITPADLPEVIDRLEIAP